MKSLVHRCDFRFNYHSIYFNFYYGINERGRERARAKGSRMFTDIIGNGALQNFAWRMAQSTVFCEKYTETHTIFACVLEFGRRTIFPPPMLLYVCVCVFACFSSFWWMNSNTTHFYSSKVLFAYIECVYSVYAWILLIILFSAKSSRLTSFVCRKNGERKKKGIQRKRNMWKMVIHNWKVRLFIM